jgi:hypothetical protein
MTQLINIMYESGESTKDFVGVSMIALKWKPKATNCSDHRTVSLIAHTAKIAAKVHSGRVKGPCRMYLEKISLDSEEEK